MPDTIRVPPIITFDHVHVRTRGNEILHDVCFELHANEKIVFCGSSGSGKSTVLKTIAGGFIPAEGSVFFGRRLVSAGNISEVRKNIAYIAQEPVLGAETVRDALLLPFTFKSHRHCIPSETQMMDLFRHFHLSPSLFDQSCSALSGGEKQRIAIIRAVLLNKSVFLADEITSALDHQSKQTVLRFLMLPQNTVISVSHDPEWISKCDRVLIVEEGRVKEKRQHAHH